MSVINDALKRAKQAQQKSPAPLPATATAMRTVEATPLGGLRLGSLLPFALVTLVGGGALLIWFTMKAGGVRQSPVTVAHPKPLPATVPHEIHPESNPKPAAVQNIAPATGVVPMAGTAEPTLFEPQISSNSPPLIANLSLAPVSTATTAVTDAQVVSVQLATPSASAVVASQPPSPPPLPRLQGIFYRPQRPAALVDGKMVLIGSTVGEHRIVAISQQSVTIARAGQTNILEMPD